MSVVELLARLREAEIQIWVEGEKLRFRAPKGAMTADYKARLGRSKAEVIAFLRQTQAEAGEELAAIDRAPRDGHLPLSFAQQRLWFIDQLEPGLSIHNMPSALRLEGELKVSVLSRATSEIERRHESLRTVFDTAEARPVQVVRPWRRRATPCVDLSGLRSAGPGDAGAEEVAKRLIRAENMRPFDLQRGPLCRLRLLRLAPADHILILTLHHIVSDGWSMGILVRELTTLYAAFLTGAESPLAELQTQYPDFAYWQRQRLDGAELDRQSEYWRGKVRGVPTVLELPTDRPRPARQSFAGDEIPWRGSPELARAVTALARAENASPFMVILAAFSLLLSRFTGQRDLVVGSPIANRNQQEIEPLIGFFVNTLILRVELGESPSFRQLVAQVRETTLGAYSHQDYPFERLVELIDPRRDLSRNPVFQVIFALQNAPTGSMALPGLQLKPAGLRLNTSQFEWNLMLRESEAGLHGSLGFSTALFDATTIHRALASFGHLLSSAVAAPEGAALGLDLLSRPERQQLQRELNATQADYPRDLSLGELFTAQARLDANASAVEYDEATLSYGQLAEHSSRLAARLRRLGVGRGRRVGICLERSPSLVVAVLAVVKAGGCYVPLDPIYPRDRLAFIVDDAQLTAWITSSQLRSMAGEKAEELPTLLVDEFGLASEESGLDESLLSDAVLSGLSDGDSPAYVIYTSGSTGKPKGAQIVHRGVTRLVRDTNYLEFAPGHRVAQMASAAFDATTFELWGALLNGGCLVGISADELLSPATFGEVLQRKSVSHMVISPALFNQVVGEDAAAFASLEVVCVGGEALNPMRIREALVAGPPRRLLNAYGPTECTVIATYSPIESVAGDAASVPIGRALANTEVYVLRPDGVDLQPVGSRGELALGGDGLMQGYLGRPALTASRLIPHPFRGDGRRLYRTGDLVRMLPDGRIDFLGRIDHQVKIRGFRIELGEIESLLASHPAVSECVVLARGFAGQGGQPGGQPGDQRLVAYLTMEHEVAEAQLRDYLTESLPSYMVPTVFVALEEFPVTVNQKIDRRALPDPDPSSGQRQAAYEEPRGELEGQLAAVWKEVLAVERVGRQDGFFDLGGHSLLATQVVSRLRDLVPAPVPVKSLFENPTLAGWARAVAGIVAGVVDGSGEGSAVHRLPPLVARPREPDQHEPDQHYPLSFAQQRLWFLHRLEPANSAYHLTSPMRIQGPLVARALHGALNGLVARHEALRTRFGAVNALPVQIPLAEAQQAMPVVDLSALAASRRDEVAARLTGIDLERPFSLESDPLLRTVVLRLAVQEHALLLNMHHIVSDGWSLKIFFQELLALYQAVIEERPSPLPPLPLQYIDFALWQREFLEGPVLEGQLDYWVEQLRGAPALLELPLDRPRELGQGNAGWVSPVLLPPELTEQVRRLSRAHGVTPFVTLISAFAALMARSTGQEDIPVGIPVAGRNQREIEDLIGFFVSTLVLRADLSGEASFTELLSRVGEVNAELNSNQDVPFDRLVDRLAPERSLGHTPLFQVIFSYQANPGEGVAPAGSIQIRPQPGRKTVAMYDLSLSLDEQAEFLSGHFVGSAALFDRTTVVRLAQRFRRLLSAALATPSRALTHLALLSLGERQQLIHEWDAPAAAAPAQRVQLKLATFAARYPDRVALVLEGEAGSSLAVSYGELLRRAEGWARRLRRLGVGGDVAVALALERSPVMIEAMVGVLLAGGCYLPLDPDYPQERLRFMLHDARPRVLLTQAGMVDRLAPLVAEMNGAQEGHACTVLVADKVLVAEKVLVVEEEAGMVKVATESVSIDATPHPSQAAYVIYTSGSTGKPKGVVVTHRGLAGYVAASARSYQLDGRDRWLQFSSVSFDASAEEIFCALCSGASLFLRPAAMAAGPSVFFAAVERWRLTVLGLPTAYWHTLAASGKRLPDSVRLTILGGEAALPQRVEEWCERAPLASRLVNTYGPTETTICATHWTVDCAAVARRRGTALRLREVPIGRAVDGVWLRVVDRGGRPVPIGVAGELMIGGSGVARGYLGRPSLTAERFVPDGGSRVAGERLYRSGDLVRTLQDGTVQFLGRVDQQIKVRGFRVEPGEVEAALSRHPAIREVVVGLDKSARGEGRLVAWFVAAGQAEADEANPDLSAPSESTGATALRAFLAERLPAHLIPTLFVELQALPKSGAGKVDRRSLPAPDGGRQAAGEGYVPPTSGLEKTIAEIWCAALGVDRVGMRDNFFDLGGHSLLLVRVQEELRTALRREVSILDLFRFPTVAGLVEHLQPGGEAEAGSFARRAQARLAVGEGRSSDRIAIIGMAARFPKARSAEEFWVNLRDGVECLTFFSREELLAEGLPEWLVDRPEFVAAYGWYDGVGQFDPRLFAISPREAEILDPQHRAFLECAWEALEHAGHAVENFPGRIGLFAGTGLNHYIHNLLANPAALEGVSQLQLGLANDKDFLPTRVSYKMDLRGPSINVQTACSTGLVAAHLACRSLAEGECEMALAGGVGIKTFRKMGYLYDSAGILSSDGRNRAFDAKADGSAGGDGLGIVVLKRLDDALRDGDTIYAVIRGSAVNNDGSNKVGFTAPSIEGQAEVIAAAQVASGVEASEVSFVETHGTATSLGDPIEAAALREIFGKEGGTKSCALGAVKSNIGHTDSAAGVAGLIKTTLALHHRQIPPTLHFEHPNPKIDFENSPLYVNTELRDWTTAEGQPRIAGVSSFGLGGTNVHMVLEEAPEQRATSPSRDWQIVPLSALSPEVLSTLGERLLSRLEGQANVALADLAFTLQQGRKRLPHRQAVVVQDEDDLLELLREGNPERILVGGHERSDRPVVWLLPGLGDHYPGMGGELYATEPTFKAAVDRCCELLQPHLGEDLRTRLFAAGEASAATSGEMDLRRMLGRGSASAEGKEGPLDRTRWAQPAVFVIEYALAQLWLEWGPPPEAMIGYSLGEYTVACLAGVLELEEALELVAARARMIDALPVGRMLAVPLAEAEILPWLTEELSLAALNGPNVSVVSGDEAAIAALEERLAAADVVSRRLRTTHGFHSHLMRPIAQPFQELASRFAMRAPKIPYLSNVTGGWMTATELDDPTYWVRHLCDTVRFADGMSELLSNSDRVLLEIGPGQALSTSAMQHPDRASETVVISTLRDARQGGTDQQFLLTALGRLWIAGGAVDWRGFARHERRQRLALPTYPFDRQRYWIDPLPAGQARQGQGATGMKTATLADWFYLPRWRPSALPPPPRWSADRDSAEPPAASRWLVLSDGDAVTEGLIARLAEAGQRVQRAEVTDIGQPEVALAQLEELLLAARDEGRLPGRILHGWAVGGGDEFEELQQRGLYSVSALVALLSRLGISEEMELTILSRGLNEVLPSDQPRLGLSTLHGALLVVPQEYRNLRLRSIDFDGPAVGGESPQRALALLLDDLMAELAMPVDRAVAWRGGRRFLAGYEAVPLAGEPPGDEPPVGEEADEVARQSKSVAPSRHSLRRGGVYLMTGGFGYVGSIVCRNLARQYGAKLVLLGRSPIPARQEWERLLADAATDDAMRRRIELVGELEGLGAEVLVVSADVADGAAMEKALQAIEHKFGALNGVFHLAAAMSDDVMTLPANQLSPAACQILFRAKVDGLFVLDQVLAKRSVDFCLLFSSMSSVLGGLGFAAYAAANAFVDAFAARQHRLGRYQWVSANWDGWLTQESDAVAQESLAAQYVMTPNESGEAIRRLLALYGVAQVVVSTGDLDARLRRWIELQEPGQDRDETANAESHRYDRPDLATPYVEPQSEVEQTIASLWQELLGIDQVGLHDDFFQLGGDSLLATQLASRMRAALKMEVPLGLFFSAPNVFQMAAELEQGPSTQDELSEIEKALLEIGDLSEEDILGQLEQVEETET